MPELLNHPEFCENLGEINSPKIFDKKKFHPEGLFSEQIFGPLNNYTCQCGIYYGVSKSGGTCGICGVDIISARSRRERFGKIVLPIKVVNPLFYDLVINLAGNKIREPVDKLMTEDNSILCKKDNELTITESSHDLDEYDEHWEGLEAIYEIVKKFAEEGLNQDITEWNKIYDNLDKLLISEIIVLPPELRPTSLKGNVNELDEINRFYTQILMKKQVVEGTIVDIIRDKKLFYQYYRQIQKNVHDLYKQIVTKMSKKEGLIRGNILGKRIDFSGRGVITPDPTINIDECVIPYIMFLELFKLEISKKLIDLEKFKLLNNAIDFVDECIKSENPILLEICDVIKEDKVCLLNRQPSLHRLSVLGFKMKIGLDKVIKIHPLICNPLNADHDGDSVNADADLYFDNKNVKIPLSEVLNHDIFSFKSEKTKSDGKVIKKYSPNKEVKIKAINSENGNTGWKNISEFSVHENLNMFMIEDPKERFETFWASSDHSLLVFDEKDNQIKKITPNEIKENPEGKYVIQGKK